MEYGKPTVRATLNGKGPWDFFVDTGAGDTILDQALVEELGLTATGKQPVGVPSKPEAINADIVAVDSIVVGSVEFFGGEALSWDRADLYKTGDRPRGVLGIGFFAEYLLSFDYPAGELVLT